VATRRPRARRARPAARARAARRRARATRGTRRRGAARPCSAAVRRRCVWGAHRGRLAHTLTCRMCGGARATVAARPVCGPGSFSLSGDGLCTRTTSPPSVPRASAAADQSAAGARARRLHLRRQNVRPARTTRCPASQRARVRPGPGHPAGRGRSRVVHRTAAAGWRPRVVACSACSAGAYGINSGGVSFATACTCTLLHDSACHLHGLTVVSAIERRRVRAVCPAGSYQSVEGQTSCTSTVAWQSPARARAAGADRARPTRARPRRHAQTARAATLAPRLARPWQALARVRPRCGGPGACMGS